MKISLRRRLQISVVARGQSAVPCVSVRRMADTRRAGAEGLTDSQPSPRIQVAYRHASVYYKKAFP